MKQLLLLLSFALTLGNVAQSQNLKSRTAEQKTAKSEWTQLLEKAKTSERQAARSAFSVADATVFTEITSFPYELQTTFTAETPVVYSDIRGFAFKFTLTETKTLNIRTEDGYFNMGVFTDETLTGEVLYASSNIIYTFPAGTYYVVAPDFGDRFGSEGEFPVHFLMEKMNFTPYQELNYSTALTFGQTAYKDDSNSTPYVSIAGVGFTYTSAGYHFAAQAGHTYKVTYSGFANQNYIYTGFALLKNDLTGNFEEDRLAAVNKEYYANNFTDSIYYTAEESGDIKVLFGFIQPNDTLFYSVLVEDAPALTFESITLPYLNEQVDFTSEAGAVKNSYEYLRGFTFTLSEETTLYFYGRNEVLDWGPNLYVSQTPFDASSVGNADDYFIDMTVCN